ncbi:MAG: ATP-binding protein [Acidobacteriota bacterium]
MTDSDIKSRQSGTQARPSKDQPSLLTLDSELSRVEAVETRAEQLAHEAGFDEDTSSQIAMVTREAVINAILHGNKRDPNKKVRIGFALSNDALSITIADEGLGLDPDSVPDPCAPENILRSSGRGIFLMRAIMDEVHFHQLSPGTEIELIKHRIHKES